MLVRIARLNALQHCYKPLPNFALVLTSSSSTTTSTTSTGSSL